MNNSHTPLTIPLQRAKWLGLFLLAFAFLVLAKILHIQWAEQQSYQKNFEGRIISLKEIKPNRGNIYAQDGSLLAIDIPEYDIHFDGTVIGVRQLAKNAQLADSLQKLSSLMAHLFQDKNAAQYYKNFKDAITQGQRYQLIQRNATYMQMQQIKNYPLFNLGRYKGGMIFVLKNKRYLPHGDLARRTVGYFDATGGGVGLEKTYDMLLAGKKGVQKQKRIGADIWVPLSDEYVKEPQKGADLHTHLDINLQDLSHNALLKRLKEHDAAHGTLILMEVQTGAVRALVNLSRRSDGSYHEDFNHAVGGYYEPGSTFKIAAWLLALEDKKCKITDTVDTYQGVKKFYNLETKESKKGGYGKITVQDAIAYSSNIAVSEMIFNHYQKNPQKFIDGLQNLGISQKSGIDLLGEKEPYLKSVKDKLWSGVSLPQMAIGYEVLQSPIQILTFYNGIANQGKMIKPRLVSQIAYSNRHKKTFSPEVLVSKMASAQALAQIQTALESVVEYGTASSIKNPYFKIAGKTGTAQMLLEGKKYKDDSGRAQYLASFVGYFPADNPKYTCFVAVSAPNQGGYYSSEVAAPIFKDVAYKIYAGEHALSFDDAEAVPSQNNQVLPKALKGYKSDLLKVYQTAKIPLQDSTLGVWAKVQNKAEHLTLEEMVVSENTMPNVQNMGLRDALYLLENKGLQVQVEGKIGRIKTQNPLPGAKIQKGQTVWLKIS
jgi:cell division protein FtsI (penicillin-binding protein 3)